MSRWTLRLHESNDMCPRLGQAALERHKGTRPDPFVKGSQVIQL